MDYILSTDLLQGILSYAAENPGDVGNVEQVNRSFLSASQISWRNVAQRRYGKELFEATVGLYNGSAKEQLKDGNRLGSDLRLLVNKPCFYRHNQTEYFFCCLVHSIQWDRLEKCVKIHLDVRGERDLRTPLGSTLHTPSKKPFGHSKTVGGPLGWRIRHPRDSSTDGIWKSLDDSLPPGHFKGALEFGEICFSSNYGYDFCYSNQGFGFPDYEIVPILPPFSSLGDLFSSAEYVHRGSSPFDNDTEATERLRWEQLVPQQVWTRTSSLLPGPSEWWA